MKNIIIGTAGHIDHGKTTLVKALTGRETDTLKEEKKRGISINLGFTYLDLPNGNRVGIVDVPGHERFIKNMMAGATGIDLVLFIIAADEGVMPQSREHLDILSYMNVHRGIMVITKSDMVEDDYLALVEEELKEFSKGTFLENAPIAKVDSISGRGIDELKNLIASESEKVEEKKSDTPFRMHIDRAFPVKGIGIVVTGTLMEGKISRGDDLIIYPEGKEAKVRSIQVHGEDEETAYAGQRTAINLSGIKSGDIERGDVIASEGSVILTNIIDCKVMVSKASDFPIHHWMRLRLGIGTREIFCRAVPLDQEEIGQGEEGFLQLRLEEPLVCRNRDRFVLRSYSPVETIGGGVIIEPMAKKHNIDEELVKQLQIKEQGELDDIIFQFANSEDALISLKEIVSYTGENKKVVSEEVNGLISEGKIVKIVDRYVSQEVLTRVFEDIEKILEKNHEKNPLALGMTKNELLTQNSYDVNLRELEFVLKLMKDKGIVKESADYYGLTSHKIKLTPKQEKTKEALIREIEDNGLEKIENLKSLAGRDKDRRQVLEFMIGNEIVVFGAENNVLLERDFNMAKKIILDYLNKNETITVSEARDLLKSSRKNVLLILDYFDHIKLTKRVDDYRVLV
ncbi:selenocysteine-specific translation elongation factor [Lagierella sp.]|uniref:selenocysteine-specific translation elongation factor n=1 Tax=Lagierella sp. TaxID=2849657 RepID=UPI00261A21A4|nr:selenocysteine-specific translation elongation factor [Lagierella sp.]